MPLELNPTAHRDRARRPNHRGPAPDQPDVQRPEDEAGTVRHRLRVYRARAQKAVLISSPRGAAPDRLAVQLPPTGRELTQEAIAEYANNWGFPASPVERWRTAGLHRAASDH